MTKIVNEQSSVIPRRIGVIQLVIQGEGCGLRRAIQSQGEHCSPTCYANDAAAALKVEYLSTFGIYTRGHAYASNRFQTNKIVCQGIQTIRSWQDAVEQRQINGVCNRLGCPFRITHTQGIAECILMHCAATFQTCACDDGAVIQDIDNNIAASCCGAIGVNGGKGEGFLQLVSRASCTGIGVGNIVTEGVGPSAGSIDNQSTVKALHSQGIGCITVNEDGIAATEIKRTRRVRPKIHIKVSQGAAHGQSC